MAKARIKWKMGWGVTARCNMHCPFCYSSSARQSSRDLPLGVLTAFVDRNAQYIDSINYGTGENTLSDTWFALLKYIQKNHPHIPQALTTNGYLFPALADRSDSKEVLAALTEVDVSIDFSDSVQHSRFRGCPDAFEWATSTVDLCRKHKLSTSIVVMGTDATLNRESLDGIFALAEANQCFVRINIFRPNDNQNLRPLSYQQLKDTIIYLLAQRHPVALSDPLISALVRGVPSHDPSGQGSLRILPDGSITPSTYLISTPWLRESIETAHLGSEGFRRSLGTGITDIGVPEACLDCPVVRVCQGGAIDRRVIWYSDILQPDPYCPYRQGDDVDGWRITDVLDTVPGPTIHDGYLPTLIFSSVAREGKDTVR